MTAADLQAIEDRANAATERPWSCVPSCCGPSWGWDVPELEEADYRDSRFGRQQDAAFIAASRADVPALLAEVRRYRDFCRRLVTCADGESDVFGLVEEVRAAIEEPEGGQS